MKIAFLTYVFPALSESFILDQITGLIDLGHDVGIIAYSNPMEDKTHPDVIKYNLADRTYYIPPRSNSKTFDMLHAALLISRYTCLYPRSMLKFIMSFAGRHDNLSIKKLHLLIHCLKNRYDVIHCNYGRLGPEGIFLKQMGVDSLISTAFHGNDISSCLINNNMGLYKDLFRLGDLFLPVSNYWKNILLENGCPEEKTHLHRMGIDIDRFNFRHRPVSPESTVNLLTIGRLVEKKGHEYSLRAVACLVEKGFDIKYTIAGDGPLKEHLVKLSADLNIDDHVKFTGHLSRDEVINLLDKSHIFVLPSITSSGGDMEGIPMVIMEAAASGIPVVSTRHSGIPELIQDGYSGLLVEEKNFNRLSDALEDLILNKINIKLLTENALDTLVNSFSLPELCRSLENILSRNLNRQN